MDGLKCSDACACSNCQNSMRDDKNEEDQNEKVESEDDPDFETENYFSERTGKEQVFYVHQLIFYY